MPITPYVLSLRLEAQDAGMSQAVDQTSQALKRLGGEAQGMQAKVGDSFKAVASGFVALLVAKYASRAIVGVIRPAAELQEAMTGLRAVSRFTSEELDLLRAAALKAAAATTFSPTEAIEGLREFARVGLTARTSAEAILPVLGLAQMGDIKVAEAADLAAQAMRAFGIASGDLPHALGATLAVSKQTLLPVDELRQGLGKLAMGSLSTATNLNDAVTMLGLARNILPSAAKAATGLSTGMRELTDPTRAAKLKEYFGVAVSQGGRLRPVFDILVDLAEAFPKTASAGSKLAKALEVRGAEAFGAVINQMNRGIEVQGRGLLRGAELLDYFRGVAAGGAAELDRTIVVKMQSLNAQLERLHEALRGVLATVGTPLVEWLTGAARGLGAVGEGLSGALTRMGPFASLISSLASGVMVYLGVLSALTVGVFATAGAFRILGVAGGFVRGELTRMRVAIVEAYTGVQFLDAATGIQAVASLGRFRVALMGVAVAARAVGKAFLWGLAISALFEGISFAMSKGKELLGIGDKVGTKVGDLQRNAALAMARGGEVAGQSLRDGAEALGGAGVRLDQAAEKLKSIVHFEPATFDERKFRQFGQAVEAAGRSGQISASQLGFLRENLSTVGGSLERLKRDEVLDPTAWESMRTALKDLVVASKVAGVPGLASLKDQLEKMFDAVDQAQTPEMQAFWDVWSRMGGPGRRFTATGPTVVRAGGGPPRYEGEPVTVAARFNRGEEPPALPGEGALRGAPAISPARRVHRVGVQEPGILLGFVGAVREWIDEMRAAQSQLSGAERRGRAAEERIRAEIHLGDEVVGGTLIFRGEAAREAR